MWNCPHCREKLAPDEGRSLACVSGHRFDLAREGYVNLLPANRKRSRAPGDNVEMIAARARIHDADLYRPLATALVEQLRARTTGSATALDLGCGEGYYSHALLQAFPDLRLYGIDISKGAVRLAARRCRAGHFAVASAFDVPLADASLDLLVSIFAPTDDAELQRLLGPGGLYLKVAPAPRHLWELRCLLYDEPRLHPEEMDCPPGFVMLETRELEYPLTLDAALLGDLVAMTPFAHRGKRAHRRRLEQLEALSLQMAFSLGVMRRHPP